MKPLLAEQKHVTKNKRSSVSVAIKSKESLNVSTANQLRIKRPKKKRTLLWLGTKGTTVSSNDTNNQIYQHQDKQSSLKQA